MDAYLTSYITKTCLYNIDPLKPHFYVVTLGFTGVYIIFPLSAQKIDCGYSLAEAVLTSTTIYVLSRNMKKYQFFFFFYLKFFSF